MGSIAPSQDPSHQPQFLVIGAGSRGHAYARAVNVSTGGNIAAVAEPDDFKRRDFGQRYIWGDNGQPTEGQQFKGWKDWIDWEIKQRQIPSQRAGPKITGVFICTLDETHAPIIQALAPLNLHILCEKPLALSLADCLGIQRSLLTAAAQTQGKVDAVPDKVFSIGHVLRYSPHNILLRNLLVNQQVIGEVVSVEHTEPVGWWHFSHSYVRGNWRRKTSEGVGSLLTKSCHDIDFLMWLLCSPSPLTGEKPHLPNNITSSGALTHFRKGRKPKKAAEAGATNCTKCPVERECVYSAVNIYRDRWLNGQFDEGWPLKIVIPEIEEIVIKQGRDTAEKAIMNKLSEDYDDSTSDEVMASRGWYGRCVYDSDNNVCDEQTVTMAWDADEGDTVGRGPKHAVFHMTYPTYAQCDRRGRIYGSLGEISYDSKTISVYTFADGQTKVHTIPKQNPEVERSHGGGDWGLAGAFVQAVQAVEGGSMSVQEAQRSFVGCDLEEVIRSHAVVFAAEEARQKKQVVDFESWWTGMQKKVKTGFS